MAGRSEGQGKGRNVEGSNNRRGQKHVYDRKECVFSQDADGDHTGISNYRPFDGDTHICILLCQLRYQCQGLCVGMM